MEKQEKEIYKKKAILLSFDEIVSKKTGEAMVKASFFVDGAVYLAWLFGNERSDFLANPKVQAIKNNNKNPTPPNGELQFELKFNEKGVSARSVHFV